ncbi:MAG: elongation factor EF-2 [Candidatus Pacearchaeota archaeon]
MAKESRIERIRRLIFKQENIRNVCTSAHIHHGKTAMTDNLLAAAGMMASKYAGDLEKGMMTWQHADEQERLLTVDAANVSMVHEFQGQDYLINLIDTPGHVDFSGNVTRAMRAVDGTIVLVCAVEGVMPQTETVIRQALKERVKPTLFINKFDRLITELKLTPEKMQERIIKIIADFNKLIEKYAEPEYKEKWKVNVSDGSVAFGSAVNNWALSLPYMQKKKVTFKEISKIYDMSEEERKDWCWKNAPLYEIILDMVIKHHPSPLEAQKYRIPKIWHGDLESEFGRDLLQCNAKGKVAFIITRIIIDPRTGKEISVGRLFSGTLKAGMEVYLNQAKVKQKIQQVLFYDGIKTEALDEIPAGNVLAVAGITGNASETITLEPETPFEEITHLFEPVVTEAIEAKKASDLPKLINVLKQVAKEDPSIKVQINEETGQHLISGMGELHLEIVANRIRTEKNVEINTSVPIVVYRETVTKPSRVFEGRSPNKHNIFEMQVEPLETPVYEAIKSKEIPEMKIKKKDENLFKVLTSLGVTHDEARQYKEIYRDCVFLDKTRGIIAIQEVIEMVMQAFEQIVDQGVLAREPCMKLKVSLIDCKLHEDAIHRGPAQVIPAVREAVKAAIYDAKPLLYEPLQVLQFEAPLKYMGEINKIIQSKRGQLLGVEQEEDQVTIKAQMPVSEMFGLSNDLRSATEGRATFYIVDQLFAPVPRELQDKLIRQIRDRKGLAEGQ